MLQDHGKPSVPPSRQADFLYRNVSDLLRRRLREGHMAAGSKLPPLKELASELSVSTMTVRRALRTLEREGHVYSIAGVGSFVRTSTPDQHGLRKMVIVGSDLTSHFQRAIARGAQRACQESGWTMPLLDAGWDVELEAANIRRLPEMGARGALILPPFMEASTTAALMALQSSRFPMVVVDMAAPGLRTDLVESDHEAGAQMATRYLIEHGHRRILLLTHKMIGSSIYFRMAGYEQALRLAGIAPVDEWKVVVDPELQRQGYVEGRKWLGGYHAILPVLRQCTGPVAVLAIDSVTAWGIYEACRELGLRIPQDVSVIAFDDIDVAHAVSPPMTIISQRTDEIGRTAVQLLQERISAPPSGEPGGRKFTHVMIDVDLIERQSVARV